MNLALPALVILLGILPGITCFYGHFAGRFDKRIAGVGGGEEIALYVLFAIPINAIALFVLHRAGIEFDFDVATHLLTGSVSDAAVDHIVAELKASVEWSAAIYLLLLFVSYCFGAIGRRFVWACRLDTVAPMLRLRHKWFYILQGRLKGRPRRVLSYADVLTRHGNDSLLYQGLVIDFEISPSGSIESLTLLESKRGSGRGDEFKWKDVPSDRFTIMGSTIHSINMRYVELQIRAPKGMTESQYRIRAWWRSFWWEEE